MLSPTLYSHKALHHRNNPALESLYNSPYLYLRCTHVADLIDEEIARLIDMSNACEGNKPVKTPAAFQILTLTHQKPERLSIQVAKSGVLGK